jgi:hypothetical protein
MHHNLVSHHSNSDLCMTSPTPTTSKIFPKSSQATLLYHSNAQRTDHIHTNPSTIHTSTRPHTSQIRVSVESVLRPQTQLFCEKLACNVPCCASTIPNDDLPLLPPSTSIGNQPFYLSLPLPRSSLFSFVGFPNSQTINL